MTCMHVYIYIYIISYIHTLYIMLCTYEDVNTMHIGIISNIHNICIKTNTIVIM